MKRKLLLALALLCSATASAAVSFGFEDADEHHYYRSTGLTSFEVRTSGDVALSPDQEKILSISPDGFLEIETRRLFMYRKVRVTAGPSGNLDIRYWRGDRRGSDEDARAFLERELPDVARYTAVGARAEARRLLAAGGPRRVLSALEERESNEAREVYVETIVEGGPIDGPTGLLLIREASRHISGSSRLSRLLVRLAPKLPPDADVTARLACACDEIESSRARREALCGIADARGIPAASAADYAHSAREISSSFEKASAIDHLAAVGGTDVIAELAGAADTIESSSERRRALTALASKPGIPESAVLRVLKAGEGIDSSSEKASFLSEAAHSALSGEPLRSYIRAADTIESSSEKRRALSALLRPGLSRDGWIAAAKAASHISSSSEKASYLVQAAATPAVDSAMLAAYLDCAGSIESSAEKRRVLLAFLHRGGLAPDQVSAITSFAERDIASRNEREAVLREAVLSPKS